MRKTATTFLSFALLLCITACGGKSTNNEAKSADTIGGALAPSSDAVDMSKKSTDSLRNISDLKVDTPSGINE